MAAKKGSPWHQRAGLRNNRPKSRRRGLPYDDLLDVEMTVLADFFRDPGLLPKKPPTPHVELKRS